jgi:hypothetical protein
VKQVAKELVDSGSKSSRKSMGSHEFEKEKEQEMKERKTSCSIDNFNE